MKLDTTRAAKLEEEGRVNPLTTRLLKAEEIVDAAYAKMLVEYGIPLFTVVPSPYGAGANVWPDDPEEASPEELAYLVQTRGQDAVDLWIAQFYFLKAQARQYDDQAEDYGGPDSEVESVEGGY